MTEGATLSFPYMLYALHSRIALRKTDAATFCHQKRLFVADVRAIAVGRVEFNVEYHACLYGQGAVGRNLGFFGAQADTVSRADEVRGQAAFLVALRCQRVDVGEGCAGLQRIANLPDDIAHRLVQYP